LACQVRRWPIAADSECPLFRRSWSMSGHRRSVGFSMCIEFRVARLCAPSSAPDRPLGTPPRARSPPIAAESIAFAPPFGIEYAFYAPLGTSCARRHSHLVVRGDRSSALAISHPSMKCKITAACPGPGMAVGGLGADRHTSLQKKSGQGAEDRPRQIVPRALATLDQDLASRPSRGRPSWR
jgi:hypothetical protein